VHSKYLEASHIASNAMVRGVTTKAEPKVRTTQAAQETQMAFNVAHRRPRLREEMPVQSSCLQDAIVTFITFYLIAFHCGSHESIY